MTDKQKETIQLYDTLVDQCPEFDRKGKTMPYTSANGHMFSLLNKAGELGFRYGKKRQQELLEKYDTTLFKSYGATMQGYILIPESMHQDLGTLKELLDESYAYVMSLDPK